MGRTHGYAPANGLKMYYEVHGTGKPLILLHGGAGATEMFSPILPLLSKQRQVILADLQCHGRTADIDRPLRYEYMADDIAAFAKYLRLEKVDLMGYSLGGGVSLRVAIQHPGIVDRLVLVSTTFSRDGWYPEVKEAMSQGSPEAAEAAKHTPMYQMYSRIAPRPEDWPVLFTKLGEMLRKDYDWSDEVRKLEIPTLLVVGDSDSVRATHAVDFFQLLGGGKEDAGWDGSKLPRARLAVLPGLTHYTIFTSPTLASTAKRFLDAPVLSGASVPKAGR